MKWGNAASLRKILTEHRATISRDKAGLFRVAIFSRPIRQLPDSTGYLSIHEDIQNWNLFLF